MMTVLVLTSILRVFGCIRDISVRAESYTGKQKRARSSYARCNTTNITCPIHTQAHSDITQTVVVWLRSSPTQTFAFTHAAHLDNVSGSSGLQCMCEYSHTGGFPWTLFNHFLSLYPFDSTGTVDTQSSPSIWPLVQRLWVQVGNVHRDRLVKVFQDLDRCLSGTLL